VAVGQRPNYKFMAIMCSAGLPSGLLTATLLYPAAKMGPYVLGGVFGAMMGLALAIGKMLPGVWKAALLPVPMAAAYFISVHAAGLAELGLGLGNFSTDQSAIVSPVALFAGGVVGGFIVLGFVSILVHSILVHPTVGIRTLAVKSLAWSLMGGTLGVIGWRLGPSLGMAIWSGVHSLGLTAPDETFQNALYGETSHQFSLFVVWQTGMALVMAIMLLPYRAKCREGASNSVHV
jgi:hypothetical protein